jgi:hypothetical protein
LWHGVLWSTQGTVISMLFVLEFLWDVTWLAYFIRWIVSFKFISYSVFHVNLFLWCAKYFFRTQHLHICQSVFSLFSTTCTSIIIVILIKTAES